MKILIVDDSATIRAVLRRALVDTSVLDVSEAGNGIEALAEIARQRFQLVILDVNMPVMDGLETLEAIRECEACAGLPVVMLTGERNETLVRRLVALGITDFLSKPIATHDLAGRLSRILARISDRVGQGPTRHGGTSMPRMLVVERDADFRHFLVSTLAPHFHVEEADSGAAALKMCLDPAGEGFEVILAGSQIAPPSLPTFATKVRSFRHLNGARLIATLPRNEARSQDLTGLFDGVMDRTYVPELFLAQLQRLIGGTETPLRKLLLLRPSLQKDTIAATEQVFGMMVSSEVAVCQPDDPDTFTWSGGVQASIGLRAEEEDLALSLTLRASIDSARTIAALMIGASPSDVRDADVLSSAAEIVNIIAGRLRNRLIESTIHAQIQLPSVSIGQAADGTPPPVALDTITLRFRSLKQQFALELTLCGGSVHAWSPEGMPVTGS